jgi:hypothetical protein
MKTRILTTLVLMFAFATVLNAQQPTVKVYLQKNVDSPDGTVETSWVSVKRTGDAKSPLRSALEWVFKPGLTELEEKAGIYDVSFGMKFEGVSLKNGTATVRFSETKESNYGTSAAGMFSDAIEKTARQFRSVKRVKICVVGTTNMDGDFEERIFLPCKKN